MLFEDSEINRPLSLPGQKNTLLGQGTCSSSLSRISKWVSSSVRGKHGFGRRLKNAGMSMRRNAMQATTRWVNFINSSFWPRRGGGKRFLNEGFLHSPNLLEREVDNTDSSSTGHCTRKKEIQGVQMNRRGQTRK